ncbi:holin [Parvibacter caecicola]|uniref:Uncharacterized 2Fe-2S/4Fe-4S cluster protein (DUF4445 family) n=1 Tax=Parvibacter caecicola TaxID=747645 RepID=A0A7W5D2P1_9ACTN|nr:holin [Parvibacter caecicola]MBB3171814.1 uncharacterized 2Fe-2S/4Fe-4S cluster protein (DUF4445 family) [Parvibacter caecicola]MCR2040627.1 holin [Parvibacter caecicola]RNL10808.1 hypothetical protein DMP11_06060 [Parvibacter caecicola]
MEEKLEKTQKKDLIAAWVEAAAIRAAKTAAEVLIILMGSNIISITDLDWLYIAGAMCWGAVLSIAFSVKGIPEVDNGAALPKIGNGKRGE